MKPKFALDLSHEGINLLHRARGGWELVGSLALDDSDMRPHLAELRSKAEALESGGITTKIIIPNSQILYTVLEAPGPDDIAREVQIRSGLDGLTPYPVGELVFDWRADGERARVAVLARETMDEAESFAVEHGFNPVSFVARPASGEFSGEPFFGKTRAATKILGPVERVEPDASPVPRHARAMEARAPSAPVPREADAAARSAAPTFRPTERPATSQGRPTAPGPAPEPVAPRGRATDDPFAELDALQAELSGDLSGVSRGQSPARPARGRRARGRRDDTDGPSAPPLAPFPPTQDDAETDTAKETASPAARGPATARASEPRSPDGASSKRETPAPHRPPQKTDAPTARFSIDTAPGARSRPASVDEVTQDDADDTPPPPGVAFSTRRNGNGGAATTATPTAGKGAAAASGTPATTGPQNSAPASPPPASSPKPAPTPQPSARRGVSESDRRRAAMADALSRPMPGQEAKPPAAERPRGTFADVAGVVREAGFRRFGRRAPEAAPAPAAEEPQTPGSSLEQLMRDEAKDEARISPRQDDAGETPDGPPKQAASAETAPPPRAPGDEETPEVERPAPVTGPEPAVTAPDTARADVPAPETKRPLPPPPPPIVPRAEAVAPPAKAKVESGPRKTEVGREASSMNVFGARSGADVRRTPKYLGLVLTLLLLLAMAIIAMWSTLFVGEDDGPQFNPEPAVETAPAETPTVTEQPPAETPPADAAPEAPVTPEDTAPTPDTGAVTPEVLTPEEAETRYAATGVWQRAPEPMAEPRSPQLDVGDIGAPAAPRSDVPEPALPEVLDETFATAGRLTPLPPPAQGTVFSLDENGLVLPSPEGTQSPRGYRVFTGPPPIVPPVRPGTVEPDDAALTPEQTPTDDAATAAAAEAVAAVEGAAAPVTSGPGDLAGVVAPGAGLPEDSAIDAAVEDAIAASVVGGVGTSIRPNRRPANIDSIVESAVSAAAQAETVIAVPESTTTPAIPTSASVADQATTPDAINLRQINLIGVSGTSNARRALVRMPNGRYVTVRVGDNLDGGQVTSITATGLTYQKGGRSFALEILPLG